MGSADPTQAFLADQFQTIDLSLDALSFQVNDIFQELVIDLGDAILDDLNNRLYRTSRAYIDLQNSTQFLDGSVDATARRQEYLARFQ